MEEQNQKCSIFEHEKIDAIKYCFECKFYLCNKCENFHSKLFRNHHIYEINQDIKEIFTGFCKEENHLDKLEFFCREHNQLCCASCICKIKRNGKGEHHDCNICNIEDIKDEKKNKLNENIQNLENLSKTIDKTIEEIQNISGKINSKKEKLKLDVQKYFTNIRNSINQKEDELLLEIDNKFNNLYFKEEIVQQSKKLPNKIQISLEKAKLINNEWNDNNKLSSLINDCLIIENNINDINELNEKIKKSNDKINLEILFVHQEEKNTDKFLENIKLLEEDKDENIVYKFKKCPDNLKNIKYEITNEKENIITKIGNENFISAICENKLEKDRVYKWKIKILKSKKKEINVGIAPIDLDIKSGQPYKYGWYYYCYDSTLYSGPPYNYDAKNTQLNKVKNEIIVIFDKIKRTLKFIVDGDDKGESYTNIPLDKPIVPVVTLLSKEDSVQLINC